MKDDPDLGKILDIHVKAHFAVIITVTSVIAFVVYFDDIRRMLNGLSSAF